MTKLQRNQTGKVEEWVDVKTNLDRDPVEEMEVLYNDFCEEYSSKYLIKRKTFARYLKKI